MRRIVWLLSALLVLLVLLVSLFLAGCGAYTSEARQHEIGAEIDTTNGKSYDATLAALLAKRRATVMTIHAETFHADLEGCTASTRTLIHGPPPHDVRLERKNGQPAIAVDCDALRDAYVSGKAIEAKDEANHDVLVVPAEGAFGGSPFLLAASGDGKLLLIEARRHKVDSRTIRVPGNCDRMPQVRTMMPFVNVFILEGHAAAEVERVTLDFDTIEIERKCDTYTD